VTTRRPDVRASDAPPPTPAPPVQPRASARCTAKTKTGRPCRAAVRPGGKFCALHDPALAGTRADARRRAAATTNGPRRRRTLPADAPAPSLDSSAALVAHLGELIHKVERGQLDTKPAAVVAQLANVLLRALAAVEVLERVAAIERAVATLTPEQAEGVAGDLAAVRAAAEAGQ
jgi:hypothetical protein